jgi:hypothetical protein
MLLPLQAAATAVPPDRPRVCWEDILGRLFQSSSVVGRSAHCCLGVTRSFLALAKLIEYVATHESVFADQPASMEEWVRILFGTEHAAVALETGRIDFGDRT